jgi:LmbE family N-acetylglucosaminyl deacetylase
VRVLAVGAHPDDVEINCSGTLLKYRKEGHDIFVVLMTSGNIGSNTMGSKTDIAVTRESEQLEAAKVYQAQVKFLRYDDQLLVDTAETRSALVGAIRWANPGVIFTHDPSDASADHRITAILVSDVMQSLTGINVASEHPPVAQKPSLYYWDTPAGHHFQPELYVDISDVMDKKLEAVSKHESQFAWLSQFQTYSLVDRCRIQSQFRGLQSGTDYAEAFRAYRNHGFLPRFSDLP